VSLLRFAFTVFIAGSVCGAEARADFAHLTLHSENGDFIGQGTDFDLTYVSPSSTVSADIRRTLPDGSPAELLWVLDQHSATNSFATLFFGTDALGIPIQLPGGGVIQIGGCPPKKKKEEKECHAPTG
jgi:hypothetical protein